MEPFFKTHMNICKLGVRVRLYTRYPSVGSVSGNEKRQNIFFFRQHRPAGHLCDTWNMIYTRYPPVVVCLSGNEHKYKPFTKYANS